MGSDHYLGIDIGGSKTKMAAFSEDGRIVHEIKIKTNADYQTFLADLERTYQQDFSEYSFKACGCGAPGLFDRSIGVAKRFGNLEWRDIPLRQDLGRLVNLDVFIENDANLAGLSEALLVQDKYKRVLYLTLSRGVGGKLIINGNISQETPDAEVGFMIFNHDGKPTEWEEFASGDALVKRFGKLASELDDPKAWDEYALGVATGLQPLLTVWQPDVVIIGGAVGTHFQKYEASLKARLNDLQSHMVTIPPIIKAQRPEEAVIYGCFDYVKQNL